MQVLYPICFSEKQDIRKILYSLSEKNLAPNVQVSFDTYFNSFYPQDWIKWTSLNTLLLSLRAKGKGKLQIIGYKKNKIGYHRDVIREVLWENEIYIEIANWKEYQILHPVIETLSEVKDLEINYCTNDFFPQNSIGFGIVICTYRKEYYVFQILERLSKIQLKKSNLEICIVDNAKTIPKELETHYKNLTILPNSNLGGSGGFARGMSYYLENTNVTHIILMDDDVEIDENIFFKLESFLLFSKDQNLAIAGTMLDAQKPHSIYETSANVNYSQIRFQNKNFLTELLSINDLLKISQTEEMEYGAWWFFTFPKKALSEIGFPLPFFLRGDDVEYSYRLKQNGYKIERINSICLWHEPFDLKLPQWIYYYTWRNLLIISAIYSKGNHFLRFLNLLVYGVYFISTFQYGILEYILDGVLDYLKGPNYLKNLNEEVFHYNLATRVDFDYIQSSFNHYGEAGDQQKRKFPKLLAFLNTITINLFWRSGFFYKAILFINTGRLSSGVLERLALSFGAKEIEILIPFRGRMRNYKKNPTRAKKLFWKLLQVSALLLFKARRVAHLWKKEFPNLTSFEFWKNRFL